VIPIGRGLRRALGLVSAVLTLAAAEGALRPAHPLWAIPYPPKCLRPDLFQRWDVSRMGYRLWPPRGFLASLVDSTARP